jgi:hypothetical protein
VKGRAWNSHDIELLVHFRQQDVSWDSIAQRLGRTPRACYLMMDKVRRFILNHGHIPTIEEVHPRHPKPERYNWADSEDGILRVAMGEWDGTLNALATRLHRTVRRSHAATLARLRWLDLQTPEELPPDPPPPAHRRIYDLTPPSSAQWQERRRREFAELHGRKTVPAETGTG